MKPSGLVGVVAFSVVTLLLAGCGGDIGRSSAKEVLDQARTAMGEGSTRLPHDGRLRACPSEPAAKLAVEGDQRRIPELCGAGRLTADDGGEDERLTSARQLERDSEEIGAHARSPRARRVHLHSRYRHRDPRRGSATRPALCDLGQWVPTIARVPAPRTRVRTAAASIPPSMEAGLGSGP